MSSSRRGSSCGWRGRKDRRRDWGGRRHSCSARRRGGHKPDQNVGTKRQKNEPFGLWRSSTPVGTVRDRHNRVQEGGTEVSATEEAVAGRGVKGLLDSDDA